MTDASNASLLFVDRSDAGRRLAGMLEFLRGRDVVILALPRGGVPVAYEVAVALDAPLDVLVVRKLGLPQNPEVAMGAIGEGGTRVLDQDIVQLARVSPDELDQVERMERDELGSRVLRFREGRRRLDLQGRTVLIIDDGLATGSTAKVACIVARQLGATRIIVAAPVASPEAAKRILNDADLFVCLETPSPFRAVGAHYIDFGQTDDSEVVLLLDAAARLAGRAKHLVSRPDTDADIDLAVDSVGLRGELHLPEVVENLVVIARGAAGDASDSSGRFAAAVMNEVGIGTVLVDLVTPMERAVGMVPDNFILARRLVLVTEKLQRRPEFKGVPLGYFDAGAGASVLLGAAANEGGSVSAVVTFAPRLDDAGAWVSEVQAPTLMLYGRLDEELLERNRKSANRMRCPHLQVMVETDVGAADSPAAAVAMCVAEHARDWFVRYLSRADANRAAGAVL
jgi:putative phosphoribosyl transferase